VEGVRGKKRDKTWKKGRGGEEGRKESNRQREREGKRGKGEIGHDSTNETKNFQRSQKTRRDDILYKENNVLQYVPIWLICALI
jgi:hypothetical protein